MKCNMSCMDKRHTCYHKTTQSSLQNYIKIVKIPFCAGRTSATRSAGDPGCNQSMTVIGLILMEPGHHAAGGAVTQKIHRVNIQKCADAFGPRVREWRNELLCWDRQSETQCKMSPWLKTWSEIWQHLQLPVSCQHVASSRACCLFTTGCLFAGLLPI